MIYEDTHLYNDKGMTQVLQGEGDLFLGFGCNKTLFTPLVSASCPLHIFPVC